MLDSLSEDPVDLQLFPSTSVLDFWEAHVLKEKATKIEAEQRLRNADLNIKVKTIVTSRLRQSAQPYMLLDLDIRNGRNCSREVI